MRPPGPKAAGTRTLLAPTGHQRGRHCDTLALALLRDAGLQQVASNARYQGGELDLVMLDRDASGRQLLVFVEVRYRRDPSFGGGAASVDARKRRKLITAAHLYLAAHPAWRDLPCRFDVVAASGDPDHPTLDWIRDAFRVGD